MNWEVDLGSVRARKARLATQVGRNGQLALRVLAITFGGLSLLSVIANQNSRLVYGLLASSLTVFMFLMWYSHDLADQKPKLPAKSLDDIIEPDLLATLAKSKPITPRLAWQSAIACREGQFLVSHLLIDPKQISETLSDDSSTMAGIWQEAVNFTQPASNELNAAALAAALLANSPKAKDDLAKLNLQISDVLSVYDWLNRLSKYIHQRAPYFGGIGRDWAAGFTPTLDRFGQNISRLIEAGPSHYASRADDDSLNAIIHGLSQGSGGIAIIGEAGSGKTSLIYTLAQRLLTGRDPSLLYHQIVSLSASQILASANLGLEKLMLTLFGEAIHAGNIILFLDDAKLFFGGGTGAVNLSQILLPILQNHRLKLIIALTPSEWQQLKSTDAALTNQLTPVNISEPDEATTMDIMEDHALSLEIRDKVLISFHAIREAYRLSGQYTQDQAYPGKAITLLEQALSYADNHVITAESVQQATEKMFGVKVVKAKAPEADALLNLEERIHSRMINQERAVSVVASALRRGRAGVTNPNRPIGSFLFLGPTGVGKTELARSLAIVYFGDEHQMIRLDMTEYQRPEDVSRLLDSGSSEQSSLIMSIRRQPFSVILFDEFEKANTGVLDLMLQLLDEGKLTDKNGKSALFRNAIIIATSNAGSAEISRRVGAGDQMESFERPLIEQFIGQGVFKAELINRFDEIVLFRPLNQPELAQVAQLQLTQVNRTLARQNISVKLTDAALNKVVQAGYDPQFGARPMRRVIQKMVEDAVALKILHGEAQAGSVITLDVNDLTQTG